MHTLDAPHVWDRRCGRCRLAVQLELAELIEKFVTARVPDAATDYMAYVGETATSMADQFRRFPETRPGAFGGEW